MTIFVFEPDAFVCADIVETLTSDFGDIVQQVPSLDQLGMVSAGSVFVLSLPQPNAPDQLDGVISGLSGSKVVLISGSEPDTTAKPAAVQAFLQRPFTSQGLLEAVKGVLSGPLSSPP